MAIVPKVGRRSGPVAAFLISAYLLLTLAGLTMVVPFLIMLTSAVSNSWDYESFNVTPRYLFDRRDRYLKVVAEKYLDVTGEIRIQRDFRLFSSAYQPPLRWNSFRAMREDPAFAGEAPFRFGSERGREDQIRRIHRDYLDWVGAFPDRLQLLPMFGRLTRIRYQEFMRDLYETRVLESRGLTRRQLPRGELEQDALALMADTWQDAKFKHFFNIEMVFGEGYPYHLRAWLPPLDEQRLQDYLLFVDSLPGDWKIPITARHLWLRFLENSAGDLAAFRQETGLQIENYSEVALPETEPANAALARLWRVFVTEKWPLWMTRLPPERAGAYRAYLAERAGSLERFNRMVKADYPSWDDVPYTGVTPVSSLERNFWRDFLLKIPPEELSRCRAYPEQSYRRFLETRYGSVEALNRAYGWTVRRFDEVDIPIADVDYGQFLDQERGFVRTFLTFNFTQVFTYMAVQGRALFNTLILVALTIFSCLTVNPLAAYALSRFRLRSTHKVLLFLLATMAFPAEVSMIPNFLLIRELGLLNTFGALILPGLASGFGIFLLKGFFDSLPAELYEAATIDGAGEFTMFTSITLPLSKPILAYQALLAFIGAYGGFMWAFLVCQEPRMWTVMVWIYQYQQAAAAFPYMVMAAFVLVSIPTLLVFVFCQKIILRGIIIPTMK